jgi:lipopolysaccharide transport system permease protein
MGWYGFIPSWRILYLPGFALMAFMAALGAGFWLSALNVKYRDFRYVIPFIVQFGLLISPVGFASSVVPESWRLWYSLNPVVGVIDGFRWAILAGKTSIYVPGLILSIVVTITIFFTGLQYFRTVERGFADVI